MGDAAPEKTLKELEGDTSRFRFDRSRHFQDVAKKYEKLGDKSSADKARTEAAAFMLHTRGDSFPGYFQPLIVFTNGATAPSRDFFNSERLNHLTERAKTSQNPIHSSRFADVVWDLSTKKNPEMARIAIDKYLGTAEIYEKNGWGVEFGEVLKRSAFLASMIHDSERLIKAKETILKYFRELDARQEYRSCLDLADAIAGSHRMELTKEEWLEVFDILNKAVAYFQKQHPSRESSFGPVDGPNEHFVRSFHEAKLKFVSRTHLVDDRNERLSIAQSYEREGDLAFKSGNYLASLIFYKSAEKAFADLQLQDDRDRLRVKLADAGRQAEGEMRLTSIEIKIEKSKIEEYIKPLLKETLEDSLNCIAAASHFIPDVGKSEKAVEEHHRDFPLKFLFPRTHLRESHIVGSFSSEEELENVALTQELVMGIQVGGTFRDYLFDKLKKDYALDKDSLTDHFRRLGLCKPRNLALLEKGFEHYFRGDYISSLHILVPQFEDILRNILHAAGRPISRPEHGVAVLKSLLSDKEFISAAGVNLKRYYELVLCGPNGLNLRNDLAHGLLEPNMMDKSTVELILHLLLTLTRFRIKVLP